MNPTAASLLRSFRRFPAPQRLQSRIRSDHDACRHCLGGTCCVTEDPITLTAFDILRLAAFLDLTPRAFLAEFTQDRFADDDDAAWRSSSLAAADSSAVAWLRRRANSRHSPCLFLKYTRDPDGTPRRVCSVHPARPLACREYYHDTCKTRWTGEIAVLQAHGFEAIRRGRIGDAEVDAGLRDAASDLRRQPGAPRALLARAFWSEMRRALHPEACNAEGARSFDIRRWQDPPDLRMNRLLSRRHLRLEERYGPEPWGDQLQPYEAGNTFHHDPERRRLLALVRDRPASDYFTRGDDYPLYTAHRDWLGGAGPAVFPRVTPLAGDPGSVVAAQLRGWNAVARMAGYAAVLGRVLELQPAGTLEGWFLAAASRHDRTSRGRPDLAHPAPAAILAWARSVPGAAASARAATRVLARTPEPGPGRVRRLLAAQQPDGTWGPDPAHPQVPGTQGEYLQQKAWQTLLALDQLLRGPATGDSAVPAP